MNTKVNIKKLNENAIIPTYQTEGSAGADLYACIDKPITIKAGGNEMITTGLAMEIPTGIVGLIYARSGLACKKGIAPRNKVGVIDSDYRGEIKVALSNQSNEDFTVNNGERIAHIVFTPYYTAQFEEVDSLLDTKRGTDGFGSTGNK